MPYGAPGVPWSLLDERGIQVRWTAVDPGQVARQLIADSGFPDVAAWVQDYVLAPPSDLDALHAFASRDGRAEGWDSPR